MATVARMDGIVFFVRVERNHQLMHGHARAANGRDLSFTVDSNTGDWKILDSSMEKKNQRKVERWLDDPFNQLQVELAWRDLYERETRASRLARRRGRDALSYRTSPKRWADMSPYSTFPCKRIVGAEWLGGFRYRLAFDDGAEGILDMTEDVVRRPGVIVADVRDDPAFFGSAFVSEFHGDVLRWPGGFEVGPEYAYDRCIYNEGLAFADEPWKRPSCELDL